MKLAVIVTDFGAAANVGADVERKFKTFDLPAEISDFIKANSGKWTTVSLAVEHAAQEGES
jgi:hypothetical protein